MHTNRMVVAVAAVVVAVAVVLVVAPRALNDDDPGSNGVTGLGDQRPAAPPDRTRAPVLDGSVIKPVGPADRPPEPAQWAAGPGPIPSATWWSSAVTGPGAISLWPQPLALTISQSGRVEVAAPARDVRPDGTSEAPLIPALAIDLGTSASTRVIDHGPLHVTLRISADADHALEVTLVQGSPLVELRATGPLTLQVPGLDRTRARQPGRALRFATTSGAWLLAAADPATLGLDGDDITVEPGGSRQLVLGPVPSGADTDFDDRARAIAAHPLVDTREDLSVADDGVTTQVLTQVRDPGRDDDTASLWALQPHHRRFGVDVGRPLGRVPSPVGPVPVVEGDQLRLAFPAVPVLWSAVPLPGAPAPFEVVDPLASEGGGSYFGGKLAYAHAARSDALRQAGVSQASEEELAAAARILDGLREPAMEPRIRWEPGWGRVIIEPAEFAAGTELNDHSLQYGYWVAAAAHVAELDPEAAAPLRGLTDLLVADYAGAGSVPEGPASLPDLGTWSPYEGHSWASGTARFAAGNNLESISESAFAWWAAARWFLVTDRAPAAEAFLARFTIESALVGDHWLPDGDQLPSDPDVRPWSGVVWSGKTDATTWFDPSDEAALGIRLLPLGPASMARYATPDARAAAEARWDWCQGADRGCTGLWANLLDSDAVVAGRPPLTGPRPEASTTEVLTGWWRDLWTRTGPVDGWTCSVGAVPRESPDGTVLVLASHPGPDPEEMTCRDGGGALRWTGRVTRTGTASPATPAG